METIPCSVGSTLDELPKHIWDIVKEEKAADLIHVLDFLYNGEPPRVSYLSIQISGDVTKSLA